MSNVTLKKLQEAIADDLENNDVPKSGFALDDADDVAAFKINIQKAIADNLDLAYPMYQDK